MVGSGSGIKHPGSATLIVSFQPNPKLVTEKICEQYNNKIIIENSKIVLLDLGRFIHLQSFSL
jgi:hypothetical protein